MDWYKDGHRRQTFTKTTDQKVDDITIESLEFKTFDAIEEAALRRVCVDN